MKRIVIAGGTGFLGQALGRHFAGLDWEVVVLTRTPSAANPCACEVHWDGVSQDDWTQELEGATAVVNLAGRSVDCRYTAANRRLIMDSRVQPTRAIGEALARCAQPPSVWLNASTATIYRHNFGPAWGESGPIGATPAARDEFSVEVAQAWEQAVTDCPTPRTRRLVLRTAMVLGNGPNSVFPVLRRLVHWRLGGAMAGGNQFVSWIHETDFCRAVEWLIATEAVGGACNLAAPEPVTNRELMDTLRHICGVPSGLPAPRWLLELGAVLLRTETELVIKSRRVVPTRLLAGGFEFSFPTLHAALEDLVQSRGMKGW